MSLDRNRARQLLAKGEFQSIFIEETRLGSAQ